MGMVLMPRPRFLEFDVGWKKITDVAASAKQLAGVRTLVDGMVLKVVTRRMVVCTCLWSWGGLLLGGGWCVLNCHGCEQIQLGL